MGRMTTALLRIVVGQTVRDNYSRYLCEANVGLVFDEVVKAINQFDTNAKAVITIKHVTKTMIERGQLILAPDVANALKTAAGQFPQYELGYDAVRDMLINEVDRRKGNITNPANYDAIVQEWEQSGPGKLKLSQYGQQLEAGRAAKAREDKQYRDLLADIMRDRKTSWPQWDGARGKYIFRPIEELHRMTVEELAEVQKSVAHYRALTNATPEQQREHLHKFANTQREGYTPEGDKIVGFENRPSKTNYDTAVKHHENDTTAIAGYREADNSTDPFINPQTAREFTRAEAVNLSNTDWPKFKTLMTKDGIRLNRILAQR
jgi:hypothetical protein